MTNKQIDELFDRAMDLGVAFHRTQCRLSNRVEIETPLWKAVSNGTRSLILDPPGDMVYADTGY